MSPFNRKAVLHEFDLYIKRLFNVRSNVKGVHICNLLFMSSKACIFPCLPASCQCVHLSISEAKRLSSERPQKPSTTITTKHLAEEQPISRFQKKCDKSNKSHDFSCRQIESERCSGSFRTIFPWKYPPELPLMN